MFTYISLLRGINVGGQKKIRIDELRSLYESLGFGQVKTYIQTGNLVFNSDIENTKEIENMIMKNIKRVFSLEAPVIVRTPFEFEQIIMENPFLKEKASDSERFYVTFLSEVPESQYSKNLSLTKDDDEDYRLIGKEVYLYLENGYGRTKLTNSVFEVKLKVKATTRNWKTVNKLYQISKDVKGKHQT